MPVSHSVYRVDDTDNDIEQATHWMPLPEPPQEVN
ncbi:DUF551 domain-containing protein [Escherichia coli]|nr:DUF551 domain-containing protein [Escherichia coli]